MEGYLLMLWGLGALLLVWFLYMGYRSWVGQEPYETRGDLENERRPGEPPREATDREASQIPVTLGETAPPPVADRRTQAGRTGVAAETDEQAPRHYKQPPAA